MPAGWIVFGEFFFVCLFVLLTVDLNISYCFVWLLQYTVSFPYRLGSLKSWVSDLFQKHRCCFWRPGKFWWHTVEFRCHLNCSMQDWRCSACGEIMQNLCGTVAVSHALHFGTRRIVLPVWEPGASWWWSTQTLGCAVSERNPVRFFHQTCWSFVLSAVLHVPGVVMDGFFMDIPVNLVFLQGLGVQCVKFGFQTPAWFHSYPYDQQMELRECYFLEVKEIVSPRFSWLGMERHIFSCGFFPPHQSLIKLHLEFSVAFFLVSLGSFVLLISLLTDFDQKRGKQWLGVRMS